MIIESVIKKVIQEEYNTKMVLKENVEVSDVLEYHLENGINLTENVFRPYSPKFFDLINEVRSLYENKKVTVPLKDLWLIESDFGKEIKLKNGETVKLEVPYLLEDLNEAEYKGRKVELGKPMRNSGGGKKYAVYVMNPSTKKVKKISFGDVHGGLTAKVSNPKARKAFASRHNCKSKKDRMTAGYWACRINRYAHLWGGKTYGGYW
jgi:hypothetical protein